jgi:hypothetical protein
MYDGGYYLGEYPDLQQAVDGLARAGVHVDDIARPALVCTAPTISSCCWYAPRLGPGSPTTSSPGISPARNSVGRTIGATGPLSTAG